MKKYNLLIPMVGRGQRFRDGGFSLPKQLIDVGHQQMIDWSMSCIKREECNQIFIIRRDTVTNNKMDEVLRQKFGGDIKIVVSEKETEGTVSSCLLAEEYIDNNLPLSITTLDMYFEPHFDPACVAESDGVVLTFDADNPAYSYSQLGDDGYVIRTAEKEVISNHAHAGLYHFAKGSDFVRLAKEMIKRNIRVKNEFYVAPLYNLFIEEGMKISIQPIDRLWSMGTPDERRYFLENEYEDLQNR
jgi:dTDP-glucose pyrophosphorylase